MRYALVALSLAACTSSAAEDPDTFTGEPQRFVVDSIGVPRTGVDARSAGFDLTGDDFADNQLGQVIVTLASAGDVTEHGDDQIASGQIASSVVIVADDQLDDPTVAVRYVGADGEDATTLAGSFDGGVFTTRQTGTASVHLPIYVAADATVLALDLTRIELTPDGNGGYFGRLGGAADRDEASDAAYAGALQMLATEPEDHLSFLDWVDANHNHAIERAEWDTDALVSSLLAPDVEGGAHGMLSIGFTFHLAPCADGDCRPAAAASCFDRVRDGDETDVDCGGACKACTGGRACAVAEDCVTGACDAGTCRAPSCTDGVQDGFETDVDCGASCGGCAVGAACLVDGDCASGQCGEPCDGGLCLDAGWDTCR
jgi:hypothetical protein